MSGAPGREHKAHTTLQPPAPCSGVTHTPRGGAVDCAQVKILGKPFRSQRTLSAHPSQLEIGALSSSMSVAPPSSLTSPLW